MDSDKSKQQTTTKRISKQKPAVASKKATRADPKPIKLGKIEKAYTKKELLNALADYANLNKKSVALVIDGLTNIILAHVKKGSVGTFTLHSLLKIAAKSVAAKPARIVTHPVTGETIKLKAKPASRKIKITALKVLKDAS